MYQIIVTKIFEVSRLYCIDRGLPATPFQTKPFIEASGKFKENRSLGFEYTMEFGSLFYVCSRNTPHCMFLVEHEEIVDGNAVRVCVKVVNGINLLVTPVLNVLKCCFLPHCNSFTWELTDIEMTRGTF